MKGLQEMDIHGDVQGNAIESQAMRLVVAWPWKGMACLYPNPIRLFLWFPFPNVLYLVKMTSWKDGGRDGDSAFLPADFLPGGAAVAFLSEPLFDRLDFESYE